MLAINSLRSRVHRGGPESGTGTYSPVWSAGEDNAASLRVATKLGFVEASRHPESECAPPSGASAAT